LNEKVLHLANNAPAGEEWFAELFGALCFQVFAEYLLLAEAHAEKRVRDAPLLAWRARNLLELSVWVTYFEMDKKNARRLYEDAGRDVLDTVNAFGNWSMSAPHPTDFSVPLQNEREDLHQRAANNGIKSLDGPFKRVANAATDCGLHDHFAFNNKLLSKFAHPTAMQILGKYDEETYSLQRDYFLNMGCWFFIEGVAALERVSP
jgi:hypothetical protein